MNMAYGTYQPYMYGTPNYNNGYQYQPQPQPMNNPPMPMPNYGGQSYQAQPQQMQTSIAFINGQIEARAYPVAPGNRVYLFDTDGRTYYVKGVDFNGMPLPFKVYDYTETVEQQYQAQSYASGAENQQTVDLSGYIRRDEVESMIANEVEKRLAAMNAKKKGGETGA